MKDQSNAYTTRISAAYSAQQTISTMYPASGNTLADQLKIVARLIGGGLATPVYVVNHPNSFDTHVGQVDSTNHELGFHADILSKLSVAIAAFQNDISLMGKADKVTGMTFSEFGRRVISNTSFGTDHGSGAPVIFFGAGVLGGVTGTSPVLPATSTSSTQVPMQYDFRQLYATVMQKWLCLSPQESQTVLNGTYTTVPIFGDTVVPLDGVELNAVWEGNYAKLSFEVFDNNSYDSFIVERSVDALNFNALKTIINTSLNNQQLYTYADDRINVPIVYYRIKGISKQGRISYSKIVSLKNGNSQQVKIYPNPTEGNVNIEIQSNKPGR